MSDDLTDSQIALLCAIEEWDLPRATAEEKRDLAQLISSSSYPKVTSRRRRSIPVPLSSSRPRLPRSSASAAPV